MGCVDGSDGLWGGAQSPCSQSTANSSPHSFHQCDRCENIFEGNLDKIQKSSYFFFRETFPKLPNWKNWLIFVCFWSSQAIWVPVALKFLTQILVDWVEVSWDKAAWSDWGIRWCKAAQTRKSGRLVWYEDHFGLSKHLLYRCTICLKVSSSPVSLTGCRALSFPCLL